MDRKLIRMLRPAVAVLALGLMAAGPAGANGLLVPEQRHVPPLAIKNQRVNVTVENGVARTTVRQVFVNSTNQRLEATYIFPLPEAAAIDDFQMTINGVEMRGELVESNRARQIYTNIVRRMKDPGLLEYMGSNLVRMRVFPIEPHSDQTVQLTYAERIPYEAGIFHYVYPLRAGEKASRVLEDHTLSVRINSQVPLRSVYSPSHNIDVVRNGERSATVGFEEQGVLLNRDFELYYTVSEKDVGVSLLAHRSPSQPGGDDGYFMLLIAPQQEVDPERIVARDVTFVFDTSGSMRKDGKIEQAKRALAYCVENLNPRDRFNVIRFSTGVESFAEAPVPATPANRRQARSFVEDFRARGGTAIHSALTTALNQSRDSARPHVVVFLTDGLPTVGVQKIDRILEDVRSAEDDARIFNFGVGYDVNTRLLDTLAESSGATTDYVRPGEDIEVKVSLFQNKIAHPVLTDLQLELGHVKVRDVYPRRLPDLFKGQQLVVLGRYEGSGATAVTLSGRINGRTHRIVEDVTFPEQQTGNTFTPRLWAQKQVAFLVSELREHGENQELIDEVIQLSREHGIMTPYTSFLVLEDDAAYAQHGLQRTRPSSPPSAAAEPTDEAEERLQDMAPAPDAAGAPAESVEGRRKQKEDQAALEVFSEARQREALRAMAKNKGEAGRFEVETSLKLADMARSDKDTTGTDAIRAVGTRTFYRIRGMWVESSFAADVKVITVKTYSDAWFQLIDRKPALADALALGDSVLVELEEGVFIRTSADAGLETEEELEEAL